MSVIGGVTCSNIFHMGHKDPMQRIEPYEVRGVNGGGLLDHGKSVGTFTFRVTKRALITDVNSWSVLIVALKGSGLISCTDDRGITYTNLQILTLTDLMLEDYEDGGTMYQQGAHVVSGQIMD